MKEDLKKTGAVMGDVQIYTDKGYFVENFDNCHEITDLWEERPKLSGDTDVLLVSMKTKGRKVSEVFPILLRFDGTLEPDAQSRRNRLRRERFTSFLRHYKLTDDIEDYNVIEEVKKWKGKKVELVTYAGYEQIFIPDHLIRDP